MSISETAPDETFRTDLETLINRRSMENGSNTPDWILAHYLCACLAAFDQAIQQRENWYGRDPRPTSPFGAEPETAKAP